MGDFLSGCMKSNTDHTEDIGSFEELIQQKYIQKKDGKPFKKNKKIWNISL